MQTKLKICSVCLVPSVLWKSSPKLCKDCAGKIAATESIERSKGEYKQVTLAQTSDGKVAKPFYVIPKVSKKLAAKRQKEYMPLRNKYLANHGLCEIRILCDGAPATDLHHVRPREFFLCDVNEFMSACRACHDWIPAHDAEARELGLLKSKHIPKTAEKV